MNQKIIAFFMIDYALFQEIYQLESRNQLGKSLFVTFSIKLRNNEIGKSILNLSKILWDNLSEIP